MALYKSLFYFLTSLAPLQGTGRLDAYQIEAFDIADEISYTDFEQFFDRGRQTV